MSRFAEIVEINAEMTRQFGGSSANALAAVKQLGLDAVWTLDLYIFIFKTDKLWLTPDESGLPEV